MNRISKMLKNEATICIFYFYLVFWKYLQNILDERLQSRTRSKDLIVHGVVLSLSFMATLLHF